MLRLHCQVEHPAYLPTYYVHNVVIEHDCTGSSQSWTEDSREHNKKQAHMKK